MREYRVYKPNKAGNGAATKFQCVCKPRKGKTFAEPMIFMETANQIGTDANGNAQFDWKQPGKMETQSVLMKLGMNDVGEILAVLMNQKPMVGTVTSNFNDSRGLYHQNANGNTVLKFGRVGDQFYLAMSNKNISTNTLSRAKHTLTIAESVVLAQLLRDFITLYYEWSSVTPASQEDGS